MSEWEFAPVFILETLTVCLWFFFLKLKRLRGDSQVKADIFGDGITEINFYFYSFFLQ